MSIITSKQEFEDFKFGFYSEEDPITGKPIAREHFSNEFRCVETGSARQALFQMAALDWIYKESDTQDKIDISLKYQVLCDETAMVGVIKEMDKATGELKLYEIKQA